MANKTYRDMTVSVDNSTGLTAITAYVSSVDLTRALDLIEDSAMSDTNRSYLHGIAGTTFTLSGMVNTTTDAIYGPLIAAATSVTKTFQMQSYSGRVYRGEVLVSNVRYSGSLNALETFSADHTVDGAVTRTSVAL